MMSSTEMTVINPAEQREDTRGGKHHQETSASHTGSSGGQLVLLAVDNSHFSQTAFDYYFRSIHREDNTVLIFHGVENDYHCQMDPSETVVWPPEVGRLQEMQEEHIAELKSLYESKLEVYKQKMRIDYQFLVEQYRNKPEQSIIHAAQSHKVGLIVMGSRGMGVLRRTILGSISDYVLHHADVPVLICHI